MVADQTLVADALARGATRAALVDVASLRFYAEVRFLCERNACGKFGKNCMCPPHVGTIAETAARTRRFRRGLLVQTIGTLEDSYDIEGMGRVQGDHQKVVRSLARTLASERGIGETLLLGAGPCDICPRCEILDGKPCHLPERAMSSMEAFGMNVKEVVESCGFPYINGKNTVSYVGLILFDAVGNG